MGVKKGFLLSMDAFFASVLIITALLLYLQIGASSPDSTQSQLYGQDVLLSLSEIKLSELTVTHPVVADVITDTTLTGNDSLLYALGMLWVLDDLRIQEFSDIINQSVPVGVQLVISIEGEELFSYGNSTGTLVSATRQQITGIDKGQPVAGSSSSAYLKKLKDKQTSSFTYFGGFVGQGNITAFLELPADVEASDITSLVFEADLIQDAELFVQGVSCKTIAPITDNMTAELWDLTDCIEHLVPGNNSFRFEFADLDDAYIAGGYVKATYQTDSFITDQDLTKSTYRFPQIEGVINLYDGMIVPATLENISIFLHYQSEDPSVLTYLSLGEKVVYQSNETGEVRVFLNDSNLTAAGLDYAFLSNKTVPIRFASFNATSATYTGGNADVVVITDYSGSMKKDIDSWQQGTAGSVDDCEASVYTDNDIRRTHLARCLDKELILVLFNETANFTGNRLWPVHFDKNSVKWYDNPGDAEALTSYYETFSGSFPQQGSDKTCLACALSEAYDIFTAHNETNRSRYIVLMTDGLPTHCTGSGCDARDVTYASSSSCEGYCDENGQNCNSDFTDMCTNSACINPIDNTLGVAQDLKDDFNVTIFTVGFGPVSSCDNASQLLSAIAVMTNGTYQNSSNVTKLVEIYQNISYSILTSLNLESQKVNIAGNITASVLFDDSHINLTHEVPTQAPMQNEIEVTRQTTQFTSCDPIVDLPSGVRFKEARIVSYSGPHWTRYVTLNNEIAFNISDFLVSFPRLGDPYNIGLPVANLSTTNALRIMTGDNPTNETGCSENNSMIYTAYVPSTTARTIVLAKAEGCQWTIESEEAGIQLVTVPSSYTGTNTCEYTNASITYEDNDTLQVAVYQLLDGLDFDDDGRIFVSLNAEDLEIVISQVSSIPYMWGPILLQAEVRQ